ncbi:chorismate--pyruvate lyase family protein [Acinetobacter rudis]|uniref:Probable chorismate pyruvate-lyase n=1 Tax=Acinetobacter rudis TaxID=632955 RepID=A0AAW8J7W1_9GAMM|nr:chorismate lyase [Acinetobacter rudis]MDQ8934791.1 chorismate lyase [Acinetobacter rudis]MDQ8951456.1 chorismate lyase [Acinetobacter rudis]MDQ9017128.1 chorismate lyase [Acinetobacter rudis]
MIAKPSLYKDLDPELRTWLYASGSLTQQLTELAGGTFRVEPTRQYFEKMNQVDSRWMKMPAHHIAWVRESLLYGCEQQPWVQAKSIFPIMSLQGRARLFQHIGQQPIGRYLFHRHQPLCQRRVLKLNAGWTRQSCYTWHGCRFIVQETFLSTFTDYLAQSTD